MASHPALGSARRTGLRVTQDAHHSLDGPLVLEPPQPVRVYVDPALDPYEKPWMLRLWRQTTQGVDTYEEMTNAPADVNGSWESAPVVRGSYRLILVDSRGSDWGFSELEVGPDQGPVFLQREFVPVEGQVRLGDEPLAATLWFGGRHIVVSMEMTSDPDGRFSGWLPHSGTWAVDLSHDGHARIALEPVEIEVRPGKKVAWVDLHLPDNIVTGQVVDAEELPVPGAEIKVQWEAGPDPGAPERRMFFQAQDDGSFDAKGLPAGAVTLVARDAATGASSLRLPLVIPEEGTVGPLSVVLVNTADVVVRLSSSGAPVADGMIVACPSGGKNPGPGRKAYWNPTTGDIRTQVPEDTQAVDVIATAPGFGARIVRLNAPGEEGFGADIELQPPGGFLSLEFPSPEKAAIPLVATSVLVTNGLQLAWSALLDALGPQPEVGATTVLRFSRPLEPGSYSLCLHDTRECTSGVLVPDGELRLSVLDLPSVQDALEKEGVAHEDE